jgi:kynurenine formamidase
MLPAAFRPAFVACAALGASLALGACNSPPVRIVREVPIVGGVIPNPPFPQGWRVVDLTLPLDPSVPRADHPRQFPFERLDLPNEVAGDGALRTGAFTTMEHMGTHLSSPASRDPSGDGIDRWDAGDLLLPVVVLEAPKGEDVVLPQAITANERSHGKIPEGAVVLLRTPTGARRPAAFSPESVRLLVAERKARVVGCDGPCLDPPADARRGPAQLVAAEAGAWQLLSVRALGELPARGAWIVVGALPVSGGTGAPARVVGLLPPGSEPLAPAPRN